MFQKIEDENGGKWIVKKKFALASLSLLFGYTILVWLLLQIEAVTIADVAIIMSSLATFTVAVLGPVYAADIVDKKLNGGNYHNQGET